MVEKGNNLMDEVMCFLMDEVMCFCSGTKRSQIKQMFEQAWIKMLYQEEQAQYQVVQVVSGM
jgi:hypothetical protein